MAGIGFELRKLLRKESLGGLLQAYGYAGVISSGPWVLSILAMLVIGVIGQSADAQMTKFQVVITNLMAASLILTGLFQLAFTRFVADRLFEKRADLILPSYHGVVLVVLVCAGMLAVPFFVLAAPHEGLVYRALVIAIFTLFCMIWVATIFLSGLKQYKAIVGLFALGYGGSVLGSVGLAHLGTEGLLMGFALGQAVLLGGMQWLILRNFESPVFIAFDAFLKRYRYPSLMLIGLLFNLGVWIDKIIFWAHPLTASSPVWFFGASVIYDLPVFLAYLSVIPGMAVFLVRIETDFVEHYDGFYGAVRSGGSLQTIEAHRSGMVEHVRTGIVEIIKVQALAILVLFAIGEPMLRWLKISELYLPLLSVQAVAAAMQVVFLAILTVFFYLDRRRVVVWLCVLFAASNTVLSWWSITLGPSFYGYGFAISLFLCVMSGLVALNRTFNKLEYSTFMLQT
jgi:uncharacterized membrane protein